MKKILLSVLSIAVVAGVVIGASSAFFSDTETSVGNKFTAGTIDIQVDEDNPWNNSWENLLDKPCETNYMTFTIKNVGQNPANVWKRLTNIVNGPGPELYHTASSEPEYFEGDGLLNDNGTPVTDSYVERDNISAFMIYDMSVCLKGEQSTCQLEGDVGNKAPVLNTGWVVIIDEANQVRVDNVVDTWISLYEELAPGAELVVSQSYHLMTWDDSGQPMVTNWAQGDTMTFDVELEARQLTAPAPNVTGQLNGYPAATVSLVEKDGDWDPVPGGARGSLTYTTEAPEFGYDFSATDLVPSTNYCLIYYADPWPGTGGQDIHCATSDTNGDLTFVGTENTGSMPVSSDYNYPYPGAKIWLVLDNDYDNGNDEMGSWHQSEYLFDSGLVTYEDTTS